MTVCPFTQSQVKYDARRTLREVSIRLFLFRPVIVKKRAKNGIWFHRGIVKETPPERRSRRKQMT